MSILVYKNAKKIYTGIGVAKKDGRRPKSEDLSILENASLVIDQKKKKILWVGKSKDLPSKYADKKTKNLKNRSIITPGLVDCHTHLVFAGDRSEEFSLRCEGVSYEEVARRGGGILNTVSATRNATVDELLTLAKTRVKKMIALGARVIECKSGYGLSVESELKQLQVVKKLKKEFPEITIFSTFMGAHAIPKEKSKNEYLKELCDVYLPKVKKENLADACDIFIDEGYFEVKDGEVLAKKAQALGFKFKVHADELTNTESASFSVRSKALSADHLLQVSEKGIKDLAGSNTVAVMLPGTALYLKKEYAPARKLIDQGAAVAIATDFNPGSSMCLSLPIMMTLSALYMQMSEAEIFSGVTYNAAKALGLETTHGLIQKGAHSSVSVFPVNRFSDLYYEFGWQ